MWRITLPSLRRTTIVVVMLQTAAPAPAVRPGATADRGRPRRRVAAGRAADLRDRLRAVGARLRDGGGRGTVRARARRHRDAILADDARRGRVSERGSRTAGARRARRIGAAIMVAPLIWTLLLSLKDNARADARQRRRLPRRRTRWRTTRRSSADRWCRCWLLNSLIVAVGTTVGVLALSLARRLRLRPARVSAGSAGCSASVLLGLAIPEQAVILPRHQLFALLHLHNSYPGLILPGLVGAVRRALHDAIFPRHPARARRGGDARRRVAAADVLAGAAAADDRRRRRRSACSPSSARGTIIGGR